MLVRHLSYRELEAESKSFKGLFRKVWPIEWRRSFVAIRLYGESLYDLLMKRTKKLQNIILKFRKELLKKSEIFTEEIFDLANKGIDSTRLSNKEFFERVDQFNNEMAAYIGDLIKALETLEKFTELIRNYNIHYDRLPGEFRISQRDDRLNKKVIEAINKGHSSILKEGAKLTLADLHNMVKDFEKEELSEILSKAQELVNEGVKLYGKFDSQTIGGRDPRDPKKNMRLQFLKTYFDPETGLIGTSTIKEVRNSLNRAFGTADMRLKEIRNILTLSEEEVEEIRTRPKEKSPIFKYLDNLKKKRKERKIKNEESQKEYREVVNETIKQIESETLNETVQYVKDNNIDLDDVNRARYIHRVIQYTWDRKKSRFVSNEELMKELKLDPMIRQRIWLQVLDWYKNNVSKVRVGMTLSLRDKN